MADDWGDWNPSSSPAVSVSPPQSEDSNESFESGYVEIDFPTRIRIIRENLTRNQVESALKDVLEFCRECYYDDPTESIHYQSLMTPVVVSQLKALALHQHENQKLALQVVVRLACCNQSQLFLDHGFLAGLINLLSKENHDVILMSSQAIQSFASYGSDLMKRSLYDLRLIDHFKIFCMIYWPDLHSLPEGPQVSCLETVFVNLIHATGNLAPFILVPGVCQEPEAQLLLSVYSSCLQQKHERFDRLCQQILIILVDCSKQKDILPCLIKTPILPVVLQNMKERESWFGEIKRGINCFVHGMEFLFNLFDVEFSLAIEVLRVVQSVWGVHYFFDFMINKHSDRRPDEVVIALQILVKYFPTQFIFQSNGVPEAILGFIESCARSGIKIRAEYRAACDWTIASNVQLQSSLTCLASIINRDDNTPAFTDFWLKKNIIKLCLDILRLFYSERTVISLPILEILKGLINGAGATSGQVIDIINQEKGYELIKPLIKCSDVSNIASEITSRLESVRGQEVDFLSNILAASF